MKPLHLLGRLVLGLVRLNIVAKINFVTYSVLCTSLVNNQAKSVVMGHFDYARLFTSLLYLTLTSRSLMGKGILVTCLPHVFCDLLNMLDFRMSLVI